MMERIAAWRDSAGVAHSTLEEGQAAEIAILLSQDNALKESRIEIDDIVNCIVRNAEKIIDILTTNENSRPKARKVNGGRKARKPKESAPTPASAPAAETPPAAAAA